MGGREADGAGSGGVEAVGAAPGVAGLVGGFGVSGGWLLPARGLSCPPAVVGGMVASGS